jgi:hypothetical protein
MCTGSLLGGFLYERVGAVRTFETAAMVSAFALVLLAAAPALGRYVLPIYANCPLKALNPRNRQVSFSGAKSSKSPYFALDLYLLGFDCH